MILGHPLGETSGNTRPNMPPRSLTLPKEVLF
jgi:hypothetical protein